MRKILTVVGLAATTIAVAQSRPPDFYLDIVAYPVVAPITMAGESSTETLIHVQHRGDVRQKAMRVELVSLDKTLYEVGDPVFYEIDIQNTSREPFSLPWSPDIYLFPMRERYSMHGYRHAYVSLEVQARGSGRLVGSLYPQGLYGSDDQFWTLQKVDPGQRARIRIPGRWATSETHIASILSESAGEVQVVARVGIQMPTERFSERSTNHIDVKVSPWQTRR